MYEVEQQNTAKLRNGIYLSGATWDKNVRDVENRSNRVYCEEKLPCHDVQYTV